MQFTNKKAVIKMTYNDKERSTCKGNEWQLTKINGEGTGGW